MKVKVTFIHEPEDEAVDAGDPTGLTTEAFEELHEQLMQLGADNIKIETVG